LVLSLHYLRIFGAPQEKPIVKLIETKPPALDQKLTRLFELAARKASQLNRAWDPAKGTPVFTVDGKYTSRGWTEWTQGFQYGCALLAFDATDDKHLLELGRKSTVERMATHVSHIGCSRSRLQQSVHLRPTSPADA